jgi:hypothetical protein
VLWVDADVVEIPSFLLADVVASEKDIVASRTDSKTRRGPYDKNTWIGPRTKPTDDEFIKIRNGKLNYTPRPSKGAKFLNDFPHGERFMEVTSVGGTFLYVKADIHREGISFPPVGLSSLLKPVLCCWSTGLGDGRRL